MPADNCAAVANPDQTDVDRDRIGSACDPCPEGPDEWNGDSRTEMACPTPATSAPRIPTRARKTATGTTSATCVTIARDIKNDQTDSDGDGLGYVFNQPER